MCVGAATWPNTRGRELDGFLCVGLGKGGAGMKARRRRRKDKQIGMTGARGLA